MGDGDPECFGGLAGEGKALDKPEVAEYKSTLFTFQTVLCLVAELKTELPATNTLTPAS